MHHATAAQLNGFSISVRCRNSLLCVSSKRFVNNQCVNLKINFTVLRLHDCFSFYAPHNTTALLTLIFPKTTVQVIPLLLFFDKVTVLFKLIDH